MAFVKCSTYTADKVEQGERLSALEECCESNKNQNAEQDEKISSLEKIVNSNATAQSTKNTSQDNAIKALQEAVESNAQSNSIKESEQNERLDALEQCCESNSKANQSQDEQISELKKSKVSMADFNETKTAVESLREGLSNITNSDGQIDLLSKTSGNLLSLYPDGLYYGIEAPADVSNLYVSGLTGDDSNPGTRAQPLKTIGAAFKKQNVGTRFNLFLAEDETHEWRSSWGAFDNIGCSIQPYGPKRDQVNLGAIRGTLSLFRCAEIVRPTIEFIADKVTDSGTTAEKYEPYTLMTNSIRLNFYACVLDSTYTKPDDKPSTSSNGYIGAYRGDGNTVSFVGCLFKTSTAEQVSTNLNNVLFYPTGISAVTFDYCDIIEGDRIMRVNSTAGGSLALTINYPNASMLGKPFTGATNVADATPVTHRTSYASPKALHAAFWGVRDYSRTIVTSNVDLSIDY